MAHDNNKKIVMIERNFADVIIHFVWAVTISGTISGIVRAIVEVVANA